MRFVEYATSWLSKQTLIKSTLKTVRIAFELYINPFIGNIEIVDITEQNVDSIFLNERLIHRGLDFTERVFRVLTEIFDELEKERHIYKNPVIHLYCPYVFAREKIILAGAEVVLTSNSPFVDVSCVWLMAQGYSEVTFNLYYHFLSAFIHPFIGKKAISLVNQSNIREIYTYFNTVATNETWIGQLHLVMRMVFAYAMDKGLIFTSPLAKINDPHLKPILVLSKTERTSVRYVVGKYGYRKNQRRILAKELFKILCKDEDYNNNRGIRKNDITFYEVYLKWQANTQNGVLSDNTAKSSFHSMDIYAIPCFGDKPIQKVSPNDIKALLGTFALMGNTADFYIISKMKSLFEYAKRYGYVSDNIVEVFKSDNNPAAVKNILSDDEIKVFLKLCNASMYGFLFAVTLCTGVRIREAMALSYFNIDEELKTIKITDQMKDGEFVASTKTRRSRKIQLSRTSLSYIEKARKLQETYKENENYNDFGLIFTNGDGSPLSYTNIMRKLDVIGVTMGRPDLTPHTFRHTYMTISSRCGENLNEIQSSAGHGYSSDVITEYLHQTEEGRHDSAVRRQRYLENLIERYSG